MQPPERARGIRQICCCTTLSTAVRFSSRLAEMQRVRRMTQPRQAQESSLRVPKLAEESAQCASFAVGEAGDECLLVCE